jgi:hypothetical protein
MGAAKVNSNLSKKDRDILCRRFPVHRVPAKIQTYI